jgi:hypothetical protein
MRPNISLQIRSISGIGIIWSGAERIGGISMGGRHFSFQGSMEGKSLVRKTT